MSEQTVSTSGPKKRGQRKDSAKVAELGRQFAVYRRQRATGRHPRIPRLLKEAVVCAVSDGVCREQLCRSCGVSKSQLARWGREFRGPGPGLLARADARVFSVIDQGVPAATSLRNTDAEELELRIGPWSLRVRHEEREQVYSCSR